MVSSNRAILVTTLCHFANVLQHSNLARIQSSDTNGRLAFQELIFLFMHLVPLKLTISEVVASTATFTLASRNSTNFTLFRSASKYFYSFLLKVGCRLQASNSKLVFT